MQLKKQASRQIDADRIREVLPWLLLVIFMIASFLLSGRGL
jgi:hypothetical protein